MISTMSQPRNLSPSLAAEKALQRLKAQKSLEAYTDYLSLGFAPAKHHKLLLAELELVESRQTPRLMVLMPPGSAKSFYTSRIFPAWYLGRDPSRSVLACSHTAELAETFGRHVRNIYNSKPHWGVFESKVAADSHAAGRWSTDKMGEYFCAGVGGAIAGRRADVGLIDDPVRSREEADSERARNRTWDWYRDDFHPRLKPNASVVLVMTRWHEDDLGGRLIEREAADWKVIKLPMEAMPDDILGREVGERLWPEWFTERQVSQAKNDVRAWNALYQQEPASEEGEYFKLDWFQDFDRPPPDLAFYGASDYAVTEGSGDFTEHGVFGYDAWQNIYIMDWWRGQTTPDVWIERQCDFILRYNPLCWFGESGPIRRATEPYLLRRMNERGAFCRVEWLPSIWEKPTRARSFQALASMGKVFVPHMASWKADRLGQLTRFPAGKYDDGVDVCSLMGRGLELLRAPRIRRAESRSQGAGVESSDWMGA